MACGCPTYKLYCKKRGDNDEKDYCVTVRDDKLCLALQNNSDPAQLILVNKPIYLDKTVLWDETEEIKSGYKYIRTWIDPGIVIDALTGRIYDDTQVSIWPENKKVNAPVPKRMQTISSENSSLHDEEYELNKKIVG